MVRTADIITITIITTTKGSKLRKKEVLGYILIAVAGGLLSGYIILLSSFAGLLIKTLGIDFVIKNISSRVGKFDKIRKV